MKRMGPAVLLWVLAVGSGIAGGQSGSIVQDEHDKRIRAETEQNTKYHNNADDNPKVDTSGDAALAKRIADSFKRVKVEEPSRNYVPTAEDARLGELRTRYRNGDRGSFFDYGMMRYTSNGPGIRDVVEAQEAFLKVATENLHARFLAGYMLYNGEAGPAEMDRGLTMIRSAAKSGDTNAIDYLKTHPVLPSTVGEFGSMTTRALWAAPRGGELYAPKPKEFKMVEEHSPKAAGNRVVVGQAYLFGVGVPVDLKKAREFLTSTDPSVQAAEDLIWLDLMESQQNPQPLINQVAALAEKYDWPEVLYFQALSACVQHRPEEQRNFLLKAVRAPYTSGTPSAKPETYVDLAVMQLTGEGGPVDNEWGMANLAAAESNPNAQYILSQILAKGTHGVPKDEAKARSLLELAAKAGQADAIHQLAAK